jgi:hypothetical protein
LQAMMAMERCRLTGQKRKPNVMGTNFV